MKLHEALQTVQELADKAGKIIVTVTQTPEGPFEYNVTKED